MWRGHLSEPPGSAYGKLLLAECQGLDPEFGWPCGVHGIWITVRPSTARDKKSLLHGEFAVWNVIMRNILAYALLSSIVVLASCTQPSRRFQSPGSIGVQQLEATQFDPYGVTDAGPEIVGGRPREFQRPAAEPARARRFRDTRWPF